MPLLLAKSLLDPIVGERLVVERGYLFVAGRVVHADRLTHRLVGFLAEQCPSDGAIDPRQVGVEVSLWIGAALREELIQLEGIAQACT